MTIRAVTMFQIVCDRCGGTDDGCDYYAWTEADQARDVAVSDGGWLVTGPSHDEHHWCPACCVYDEDADEFVPITEADQ